MRRHATGRRVVAAAMRVQSLEPRVLLSGSSLSVSVLLEPGSPSAPPSHRIEITRSGDWMGGMMNSFDASFQFTGAEANSDFVAVSATPSNPLGELLGSTGTIHFEPMQMTATVHVEQAPSLLGGRTLQFSLQAGTDYSLGSVSSVSLALEGAPAEPAPISIAPLTGTANQALWLAAGTAVLATRWEISWGDSPTATPDEFTSSTSALSATHIYTAPGEYQVHVRAFAFDHLVASGVRTATIASGTTQGEPSPSPTSSPPTSPPPPPPAPNRAPVTPARETPLTYQFHPLRSVSASSGEGLLQGVIDPDADMLTIEIVSDVEHGEITIQNDGSFSYVADLEPADDRLTYKVTDGKGGETEVLEARFTLTNAAPTAFADAYYVRADTELVIETDEGLACNDEDTDPDDAMFLTTELVSGPAHGTLELGTFGRFTYTPDEGYVGHDTFRYRITDAAGDSDEADVELEVIQPPVVLAADAALLDPPIAGLRAEDVDRFNMNAQDVAEFQQFRDRMVIIAGSATVPESATSYADLLRYVETAETLLARARLRGEELTATLNDPAVDKHQFLAELKSAVGTFQLYHHAWLEAQICERQFRAAQWYTSAADYALMDRCDKLPTQVGSLGMNLTAEQWNEVHKERRLAARELQERLASYDRAVGALEGAQTVLHKTLEVGGKIAILSVISPAAGLAYAGALAYQGYQDAVRYREEHGMDTSWFALAQDLSGATSLAVGITGIDPTTGQQVSPYQQGQAFGAGLVQFALTANAMDDFASVFIPRPANSAGAGGTGGGSGTGGTGGTTAGGGGMVLTNLTPRTLALAGEMALEMPTMISNLRTAAARLQSQFDSAVRIGRNLGDQALKSSEQLIQEADAFAVKSPGVSVALGSVRNVPVIVLTIDPEAAAAQTDAQPITEDATATGDLTPDTPPEDLPEDEGSDPVASSNTVTLWRAPRRDFTNALGETAEGFDPVDYPGEGVFLAMDKAIAEGFQEIYRNGIQEFQIPRSTFDQLVNDGVIVRDGYYAGGRSWHVLPERIAEFNAAIRNGSNTYHSQ